MLELIVVCFVCIAVVIGWFALFIEQHGYKMGILYGLYVPVMVVSVLAIFGGVIYCFQKVF